MINVIIPVKNRIKYTVECITSLKKQDCASKLKIFIVDDGSTDNTKKISQKYNLRFYKHKFINHSNQLNWALKKIK